MLAPINMGFKNDPIFLQFDIIAQTKGLKPSAIG